MLGLTEKEYLEIPFNIRNSIEDSIRRFCGFLDFSQKMLDFGFSVRVFNPAGQDDIGGGCGQLWFVQKWMKDYNKGG